MSKDIRIKKGLDIKLVGEAAQTTRTIAVKGVFALKPEDFHGIVPKLIAKEGTEVKAMLNGTVTMAEKDLFYTGATLIFDHGHGISTLYMHMQKLFVKKGQKVKQGDIIGTVGATGRATGPHLDVRLNWFGVRLDPATVLNLN